MTCKPYYFFLSIACLALSVSRSTAQPGPAPIVTLDLHHVSYPELLQALERQTGYRFFYDSADLDTARVDVKAEGRPLGAVLSSVLSGTGLSYSVDRHEQVFIFRGEAIDTGLPAGFFDKADSTRASVAA